MTAALAPKGQLPDAIPSAAATHASWRWLGSFNGMNGWLLTSVEPASSKQPIISLNRSGPVWSRGRDGPLLYHAKLLAPVRKVDVDPRADANLAPPPDLGLTIDPHHAAHYQRLGLTAVGDEIGELEQLPQTNGVPADFDLHPASVDYRFT